MMQPQIIPLVVDLSHHDPAEDYVAVKNAGIIGCIFKATEGGTFRDPTYLEQSQAAQDAGLRWGSYHFADATPVNKQIDNYLKFAMPLSFELFCLDWEDNETGDGMMHLSDVITWITEVERALKRPGQCVIYSGNTAKEALGDSVSTFFGSRRLWLAEYTLGTPTVQKSWENFWLWQYTDGENGQGPHAIPGIGPCDISSYNEGTAKLIATWATGAEPVPKPAAQTVNIVITAPPGIEVNVQKIVSPGGTATS